MWSSSNPIVSDVFSVDEPAGRATGSRAAAGFSRLGRWAASVGFLPMSDHPPPPSAPPFRAIADLIGEHARKRPKQAAMMHGERRVTWEQVDAMMDRVAASLQRDGVQPRQSIAIAGANSLEYMVLFLGALRAGVAVAPLPTGATTAQLATI